MVVGHSGHELRPQDDGDGYGDDDPPVGSVAGHKIELVTSELFRTEVLLAKLILKTRGFKLRQLIFVGPTKILVDFPGT